MDRVRRSKRDWPAVATTETHRVPTRRELASYGIKLPTACGRRKAREAQRNQYDSGDQYNDDEIDAMQQDELARQFAQTQQQRYGEQYQHDVPVNTEDADAGQRQNWLVSLLKLNNIVIPRTTGWGESVLAG